MTTLWYRRPAEVWTEALPIGNGRLGGMVFGGVGEERIALNDDTLWSGAPADWNNPGGPRTLKEVREFLAAGDYARADEMCKRMMGPYTQSYLALGNLKLTQHGVDDATDYRRELDLATAVARTRFVAGGTAFAREIFASNPDQVLVVRLTASTPALNLVATLDSQLPFAFAQERGELILSGKAPALVDPTYYRRGKILQDPDGEGMRFAVRLLVHETDGQLTQYPDRFELENATRATLLLVAATSFDGPFRSPTRPGRNERQVTQTQLDLAVRKPFKTLRSTHVADHARLFARVAFTLDAADDGRATDDLLAARQEPAAGRRVAELLFQYGRYLLIAGSRPGDQPANLQGIWNAEMRAPWSGNFTTNINVEMNYWPAEPANLSECHRPLLEMVRDLAKNGRETARVNYAADGWCAHHNADLWRQSAPAGDWGAPPGDPVWAIWPMAGAWLSQHLWEHFAFNRDEHYLRDFAFPVLADACRFVLSWLIEVDGRLTTSPGTSPEHRFVPPDGQRHAVSIGPTSDLSLIQDLFTNTIEAIGILGEDAAFAARLRQTLDRLTVPRVLPDGRVAEWTHDFPGEDEQHRHVSHLFAVHPGRQWAEDERMKAAARKSLEIRGNASTGWSLAWKINLWARLGDGEQAMDCIDRLLTPVTEQGVSFAGGIYPNLFDAHPPFQIDGNFGFTAGVCEMLLQSHAGELHLLPALPQTWPNGNVQGLRARGGVTVDLSWRAGRLASATLCSDCDQQVRVRFGQKTADFPLRSRKDFLVDPGIL